MASKTQKLVDGRWGETIARQYLEQKGMRFLAANWRCPAGEVDLVMEVGLTRVLVEVRLRRRTRFGTGLETVAADKQQKLIRSARFYQQKEQYWDDIRFDVVSIAMDTGRKPVIEHIEDAFSL